MDAITYLKQQITQAIPSRFKHLTELAEKAGVNQPNLSEFMKGNRKGMHLETAWRLWQVLGVGIQPIQDATIRRLGENALPVPVEGEGVVPVGVYAVAGAGPAWDIQDANAIFVITAPPSFAGQSSYALLIDGDSMYPTIKNGAVVGVSEDRRFRQNEIFAVNIPYEGLSVKRVAIDHESSQYILRSDNPDKNKYGDIKIHIEEAPDLLVGRVVWIWQVA